MRESIDDGLLEFLNEEMRYGANSPDIPVCRLRRLSHGRIGAEYRGLILYSAFQPVFAEGGRSVVGFEGLLRSEDAAGGKISPEQVFALPASQGELAYLDRLARVIHTVNYLQQSGLAYGKLFLNVHPHHLTGLSDQHGRFFLHVLQRCGFSPEQMVLEILESRVDDTQKLQSAMDNYRSLGFGIAIDDFGKNHSNFDRLWQVKPDIVKLDRSLIELAAHSQKMRRVLGYIVQIVHEFNAKVICEGIENAEQLSLVQGAGTDWVQGFFLAKPSTVLLDARQEAVETAGGFALPVYA
jgi:EAL domain-containing protein (putative c-di-GMP-specific phosphodiesterase class I)